MSRVSASYEDCASILCVPFNSYKKEQLFFCKVLTNWSFYLRCTVFTVRYEPDLYLKCRLILLYKGRINEENYGIP